MNTSLESLSDRKFLARALETSIRIGVVALLAAWCFQIVRPFLIPVVWGIIIAVAVFPAYQRLVLALNGRSALAAVIQTLLMFVILLIPTVMLTETLISGIKALADAMKAGTLEVPGGVVWTGLPAGTYALWDGQAPRVPLLKVSPP